MKRRIISVLWLLTTCSWQGRSLQLQDLARNRQRQVSFEGPLSIHESNANNSISSLHCIAPISRRSLCISTTAAMVSFLGLQNVQAMEDPSIPTPKPYQIAFHVALDETETGEIVIEVYPEWAPLAVERFEQLLQDDFFTNAKFFRVLPGYIAQFGIAADPELNKKWMFDKSKAMNDEPRLYSNKKGTLCFASSGKNSRQTQIFINLSSNDGPPNFLDAQGFVPFARVVKGMDDVVPKIYSGYGLMESATGGIAGAVNQAKAAYYGNEYLETLFPKLSTIQKAQRIN